MGTITAQRTGSGVVSTKASQLEIKELEAVKAFAANGDASKSKEVALDGQSREPSEEFVYGMIIGVVICMSKLLFC